MYYHIWFVTKYRKSILEGEIERNAKEIFRECIKRHKYNVLELETNKDHMHMLVEAKDKIELSAIVRTLKCVSAKELFATPRFRVGNGMPRDTTGGSLWRDNVVFGQPDTVLEK